MSIRTHTLQIPVDGQEIGQRLDVVLTDHLTTLSRARVQQLIKDGYVNVDGKPGKPSYRLEGGESILVQIPDSSANQSTQAESLPLVVLYENDDLAVIDKPAGMVVHPAAGHETGTLVNAILARWPQVRQVGGEGRAGIVHRLDKDTSGVLIIAKTEPARLDLMSQFEARDVHKRYLTLVDGIPKTPTGEIKVPIGRDPNDRKRMAVIRQGRDSSTLYRTLKIYKRGVDSYSYLEVFPHTGRTHQIRVHMAFLGTPVAGDAVYGHRKQRLPLDRQFLHAEAITLTLPGNGESLTVHAPLADDLSRVLEYLDQS